MIISIYLEVMMAKTSYFFFLIFLILPLYTHDNLLFTTVPIADGGVRLALSNNGQVRISDEVKEQLRLQLITDPRLILEQNNNNVRSLEDENIVPSWFYRLNQKYPLGLLTECNGAGCSLDRMDQHLWRKLFEDAVVAKTISFKPISQKLVYTSFGSGGLFSDVVLLSKLIESGYKNIEVHLIDKEYSEIISIIKKQDNKAYDTIKTHHQRGYWLRMDVYRLTQFLSYFSRKNINVSVYIYGNAQSYVNSCISGQVNKADVLLAMDFVDDFTTTKTLEDLDKIAKKALKESGLFCYSHERGTPFCFLKPKKDKQLENSDSWEEVFTDVTPISLKCAKHALLAWLAWHDKKMIRILLFSSSIGICLGMLVNLYCNQ